MSRRPAKRLVALVTLLTFAVAAAVVPQFARPHLTAAQTANQPYTPLDVCGTFNSATSTNISITLQGGVNQNYPIAATNTFNVPAGITSGNAVCLVAQVNAAGEIVTGTVKHDATTPTTTCGNAVSFTPATSGPNNIPLAGSLVLGTSAIPVALNAAITGTFTQGTNECVTGTLNGLEQLISGNIAANSGTVSSLLPISACGTVNTYTAPGASAGQLTITTPNGQLSYQIAAGTTVNNSSLATGTSPNVCFVGTLNGTQQLTSVSFTENATQNVALCGVVNSYTPSTYTAGNPGGTPIGLIDITTPTGRLIVPVAVGTQLGTITNGTNICVVGTENGLGQVVTGAVTSNPNAATATPTATSTATATATATATGTPAPATATPTATATPVPPTATSTAVPTATATATPVPPTPTPTAKPAKPYRAGFQYVSVWYHFIRVGTQETIVVQAKKHIQHGIWATVRFPSGFYIAYYTNTDKRGFWSASFKVPARGLSKYTNEAVVTFQLWYKNTTKKSYATFYLVK